MPNYVAYHVHSDLSLLDSATKYQDYIDRAVNLNQKAIAFTEHGNVFQWVEKKLACDKAGIKYLHGVEVYLTECLYKYPDISDLWYEAQLGRDEQEAQAELVKMLEDGKKKIRDNYHTILIAKNEEGIKEINALVSLSNTSDHFYYKPRITFDEFLNISNNVIKISSCLASPLNKLPISHSMYEKLLKHYDYLEIQPHNDSDQIAYNCHLAEMSKKYNIPLIAGTDTHSLNSYKAECRTILQLSKKIEFENEDRFDLTYKTYDELVEMFKIQNTLPENLYLEAIENTNKMADSVDNFILDVSFKYPKLYGVQDDKIFEQTIKDNLELKIKNASIKQEQIINFTAAIKEECRVFNKIDMSGFMLFMSELVTWCKENGIPVGFNRGSCGGSRIAYITNITDLNPEQWHTVFSRFCNEDRKEIGDIDIDVSPADRDKVYNYIINRFGSDKTAFIVAFGTVKDKSCIDDICRALCLKWDKENKGTQNPWSGKTNVKIKELFDKDEDKARKKYPELFYFYDGLLNIITSQSVHPAGIVASPITLRDNYGTFISDGKEILQIDMECVHEAGLVKYDILGLKNIQIIKDTCSLANIPYPKSHEVNWNDENVWNDMLKSPIGIFQFESAFAFDCLKKFKPETIFDMSLVTACIRPSGASYRDELLKRKPHKNPSEIIDNLLKDNLGYLIYQEDTIKFLQQICGLSGSDADNVRRAIGRKQKDRLDAALPSILEGYCNTSGLPRDIAESEAKEFLQIIEDSASYQFGYNHSIGYCMIGYLCAYLRYYHPNEFITAYLNNANTEEDIKNGSILANIYGIQIIPPRFGLSKDKYFFDIDNHVIAKGIESVKYLNSTVANELYNIANKNKPKTFVDALMLMSSESSLNTRQREILIKLDFFKEYGNVSELLHITEVFNLLKNGTARTISKEKILNTKIYDICLTSTYTSDRNKDGLELKSFSILDMNGLLNAYELSVKNLNLPDVSFRDKISWQLEYMGYIDLTTNKQEDRRKLLVVDVRPLANNNKEIWGYAIQTQSIGSGKTARLTITSKIFYNYPVKKLDIIYAKSLQKNQKGYWYLFDYDILK